MHKYNYTHTHTHVQLQDGRALNIGRQLLAIPQDPREYPFSLLHSPVSGAVRNPTQGLGFTLEVECLVQHQRLCNMFPIRVPRVRASSGRLPGLVARVLPSLVSAFDFRRMVQ